MTKVGILLLVKSSEREKNFNNLMDNIKFSQFIYCKPHELEKDSKINMLDSQDPKD